MKKSAFAALLAAFAAAPVEAENMYAGVRLGQARYIITGVTNAPVITGLIGGYTINSNLAVEAEYIDLGNIGLSRSSAMGVSALAFYPGDQPLSMFAKLSYARSTWKVLNQEQYNASFTHGLGLHYDATPSASFRFAWNRYMIGNQVAYNIDVLSLAGMYKF